MLIQRWFGISGVREGADSDSVLGDTALIKKHSAGSIFKV